MTTSSESWAAHHARRLLLVTILALAFACPAADPAPALPPLTTVPHSPRLPGKFVWADLVTDDVPAARNFYARLFGWTFREFGNYTVALNDERPLCGLFQRDRPKDQPNAKPRWFGYISVPNVERAAREVTKAGGRLLTKPGKFPDRGEQAVFADAEGALFGAMRSSAGDPPDFLAEPGDWIWIQLLSRDAGKAADFYRTVGGYTVFTNTAAARLNEYILSSEGYARGTIRTIAKDDPALRPTWLPFVRVADIQQSVAQTRQLGGKVLIEPNQGLLSGKVAVIADPTGASMGILEWQEGLLNRGGAQ